jgi:serine/threonine-protein kinase
MGFIEGESLAERVRRAGVLDARAVVRLLQDIGYALAYAHGRGVVHRDIKPDNIMLERATGRALLMDFGISRPVSAPTDGKGLTRVGEIVGTPEYMSPEQAAGEAVDGRSDLYSLGLVAIFALTGKPLFSGTSVPQILGRQLTEVPPPAAALRPDLPTPLAAAIDRCLDKQAEARFPTAESLVEAIDQASLLAPEIPVPIRLFAQEAGTLSLVLVFLAVIGWLIYQINRMQDLATLDSMLPVIVLFAMSFARILQTVSAARRLALAGFSPAESLKGLRGVVDERESMRRAIRADPDTLRRRRRTIWMAAFQIVMAVLLVFWARSLRVMVRPGSYLVPVPVSIMAVTGFILAGIGVILLIRSPFRMPIGERLFRLAWLGPVGRGILALGARKVLPGAGRQGGKTASGLTIPSPSLPSGGPAVLPPETPLAALEKRVAALEEWKAGTSR